MLPVGQSSPARVHLMAAAVMWYFAQAMVAAMTTTRVTTGGDGVRDPMLQPVRSPPPPSVWHREFLVTCDVYLSPAFLDSNSMYCRIGQGTALSSGVTPRLSLNSSVNAA